jgi:hypothetical protein
MTKRIAYGKRATSGSVTRRFSRARHVLLPAAAVALVAIGASALSGCATKTSVTQLWSAPLSPSQPQMRKIVVMATHMDEANRRALEDSLSANLSGHGVEAIPSYKLFPGKLPEREQAQQAIKSSEADGILAANLKGVQEKLTWVPGYYGGGFWAGYYGWGMGGYYDSYVYTDEYVNVETTLWDLRQGDAVVWSALTNTKNPTSGTALVRSIADKVVPSIAQAGFIPPAPTKQ